MPTMEELWRQQRRLGKLPSQHPRTRRKIGPDEREAKLAGMMRQVFGNGPEGQTCGDCAHLYVVSYAGTYFKCRQGPQSRCSATDWRKKWRACGKFQEGPQ